MATTPRTVDAGVRLGEIFVEKYRVDAILGHGGMGVVAQCTHLALNERVAIKMLRRDVLDDADAVERFMREAQAASKIRSEYVARVTDVGRSDANVPYMVMEYLEGHDLDELLAQRGTISRAWAVELTLQACEALAEAHSLGIVHRDIKPSNLFVTWRPDGSALIKVLDFGISKALTGDAMVLTQTQSLLGTPAYMSPEQMRSARHVDARTDIWSLGTVLFEMLEGRRPFEAESFSEMCVKVAVDPPGPMPNTPPALQQVVLRCLAKPPEQRYASMAELGRDLVPFARNPHQAQLLAERMARTLRRSQVIDWSPAVPAPQAHFAPQVHLAPQTHLVPQVPALTPMAPILPAPPIVAAAGAAAAATDRAALAATAPARAALATGTAAMPPFRSAAIEPTPARVSGNGAAMNAAAPIDAASIHTAATDPAILAPHAAAVSSLSTTYRIPGRRRRRAAAAIIAAVVAATAVGVVVSRSRTGSSPPAPLARPSSTHSPAAPVAAPTAAAKLSDQALDDPATPSASAPSSDPSASAPPAAATNGDPRAGDPGTAASNGDARNGARAANAPGTATPVPSAGTSSASPATASARAAGGANTPATGASRAAPTARPSTTPPPAAGRSAGATPATNAVGPARPAHDDCAFGDPHDGCAPSGTRREN